MGVDGADFIGLLFLEECCEEDDVGGIVIIIGEVAGRFTRRLLPCIGLFLIMIFGGVK